MIQISFWRNKMKKINPIIYRTVSFLFFLLFSIFFLSTIFSVNAMPFFPHPPVPHYEPYHPYAYWGPYWYGVGQTDPFYTLNMENAKSTILNKTPTPVPTFDSFRSPVPAQALEASGTAISGGDFIFLKTYQNGKEVMYKIYVNSETKMNPPNFRVTRDNHVWVKYQVDNNGNYTATSIQMK
jgi:hypothetical protein